MFQLIIISRAKVNKTYLKNYICYEHTSSFQMHINGFMEIKLLLIAWADNVFIDAGCNIMYNTCLDNGWLDNKHIMEERMQSLHWGQGCEPELSTERTN